MSYSKTKPNNRAVTLSGANRIFEAVGIEITQHPTLGIYEATYNEQIHQGKTLVSLCQQLVRALHSAPASCLQPSKQP